MRFATIDDRWRLYSAVLFSVTHPSSKSPLRGLAVRCLGLLLLTFGSHPLALAEGVYAYTDAAGVTYFTNVPDRAAYKLVLRSPDEYRLRTRPEYRLRGSAGRPLSESPYAEEITAAANAFGLEPELLHAVITVESNHNPAAVSPKGAMGLMQLMPDTSQRFGVNDPWRPEQNIRGGAQYLAELLTLFDNDLSLALAAYNAGEQAVLRHGRRIPPYAETQSYVKRVLALYDRQTGRAPTGTREPAAARTM